MKKHFASFILLACLLCCTLGMGTAYADGENIKDVATEADFKIALADTTITHIRLTDNITFTSDVIISREVQIITNGKTISGSGGAKLIIDNKVYIYSGNVPWEDSGTYDKNSDKLANIAIDVTINSDGNLMGRGKFSGSVENNGTLSSNHAFVGSITGSGENSSTVDIILDLGFPITSAPTGWTLDSSNTKINRKVIRGAEC